MKPKSLYKQHLKNNLLKPDEKQAQVVDELQRLYDELTKQSSSWLFGKKLIKGLYVWGEVGRGKTYLMDLFFECLPFKDKMRIHFHKFMRNTHDRLHALEGHSNPLKIYAKEIAKRTRVLCFDEFVVNDITDAMVLGTLLQALFKEGVCLVGTSNTPPDRLYWHGLRRERFVPAIKLVEKNTRVMQLDNDVDYRMHHLVSEGVYFCPLNETSEQLMKKAFLHFSDPPREKHPVLHIEHREIHAWAKSRDVVWFEFEKICGVPRSQRDYLKLAEQFSTILVSHVKQLKPHDTDLTRNFINLVDVLYDEHCNLIISADVPIEELYPEGRFEFEFKRTVSRLIEMQSLDYLSAQG